MTGLLEKLTGKQSPKKQPANNSQSVIEIIDNKKPALERVFYLIN
jgi:hypothetical protein